MVIPLTGTRFVKRLAAGLAFLCAAVAATVTAAPAQAGVAETSATPQALTAPAPLRITCKEPVAGLNVVQFDCTTNVTTTAVLNIGTDKKYGLSIKDRPKKRHRIRVAALRPATQYFFRMVVRAKNGKVGRKAGTFTTRGVTQARMTSSPRGFVLNGVISFPFLAQVFSSCPSEMLVNQLRSVGAMVLRQETAGCNGGASSLEDLQKVLMGKIWWHPSSPEEAQRLLELPERLEWAEPYSLVGDPGSLMGCGSKSSSGLFQKLRSRQKNSVAWINIGGPIEPSSRLCISDTRTRNLVYVSLAGGADGILWITTNPLSGEVPFSVKPGVAREANKLTAEVATLGPAFQLGKNIETTSSEPGIKLRGVRYGGYTYLLAVNTSDKQVDTTIRSAGNKTAEVIWIGRRFRLKAGTFTESFAPLGVYVYRLES